MYTIAKRFEFSAAHQLKFLADTQPGHPCARLHGHNYVVEVELQAQHLVGAFVQDYGELAPFKQYVDNVFDHQFLNEVLDSPNGEQTTAERLARWFFEQCEQLFPLVSAVRVSETPKTWAEYRPSRTVDA